MYMEKYESGSVYIRTCVCTWCIYKCTNKYCTKLVKTWTQFWDVLSMWAAQTLGSTYNPIVIKIPIPYILYVIAKVPLGGL